MANMFAAQGIRPFLLFALFRPTVDDSEAEIFAKHSQVFFLLVNFLTKTYKNIQKQHFFEVVTGSSHCVSHHFGAEKMAGVGPGTATVLPASGISKCRKGTPGWSKMVPRWAFFLIPSGKRT